MCRGNTPEGFRSSKANCGNGDVTVIVIQCHCRRQCLKNTPTAPLPRPPTPHGQGRTLSFVVATGINNVIGNREFRAFCNYVNPPPARSAATRRRRISSYVARFHLPTGKSRCAYFFVRAGGGRSGNGVAGANNELWQRERQHTAMGLIVCRCSKCYNCAFAIACCRSKSALCVQKITNRQSVVLRVARCCHTATSERGRGWVGYLPLTLNARSEASEHAFAVGQYLDRSRWAD